MSIYCEPIISTCDREIKEFITKGLNHFREEVNLFIKKNNDSGIFGYSTEQTFAALFVNGLIRNDREEEITALQEYKLSFIETGSYGRPDIFLRVKDMAIWIECKIDDRFNITNNHWHVGDWLTWEENAILKQVEKYYNSEKNFINDTFTGGHYIMCLSFKLLNMEAQSFCDLAKSKLEPQKAGDCDRPWFYSVFFLDSAGPGNQAGIEVFGSIKQMDKFIQK